MFQSFVFPFRLLGLCFAYYQQFRSIMETLWINQYIVAKHTKVSACLLVLYVCHAYACMGGTESSNLEIQKTRFERACSNGDLGTVRQILKENKRNSVACRGLMKSMVVSAIPVDLIDEIVDYTVEPWGHMMVEKGFLLAACQHFKIAMFLLVTDARYYVTTVAHHAAAQGPTNQFIDALIQIRTSTFSDDLLENTPGSTTTERALRLRQINWFFQEDDQWDYIWFFALLGAKVFALKAHNKDWYSSLMQQIIELRSPNSLKAWRGCHDFGFRQSVVSDLERACMYRKKT